MIREFRPRPRGVGVLLSLALLFAGNAEAALHKCKMPDGSIRFSDAACPATPAARHDPAPTTVTPSATEPEAAPAPAVVQSAPVIEPSAVQAQPPPASEVAPATETSAADVSAESRADTPSRQLRSEPASKRSYDAIFWLMAIASTVVWAWFVTRAWRAGSKGWSIAMFLFYPVTLAYPLVHRTRANLIALGIYVVSGTLGVLTWPDGVAQMWVEHGVLKRDVKGIPERSVRRFSLEDRVVVVTVVRWKERFYDRRHLVEWVWLTGGEPVAEFGNVLDFEGDPYVFHGRLQAAKLGPGAHAVQVYIDGDLFQEETFEVGI